MTDTSGWRKRQIEQSEMCSNYGGPCKKEWVGLTKDEVETLSYIAEGNSWVAIELAEAKLKEKNT